MGRFLRQVCAKPIIRVIRGRPKGERAEVVLAIRIVVERKSIELHDQPHGMHCELRPEIGHATHEQPPPGGETPLSEGIVQLPDAEVKEGRSLLTSLGFRTLDDGAHHNAAL
jgi:hypothetical protein